jgi:hypothetical protein
MHARLWTTLLLLAAVFAMHGAQCTSAAHQPTTHVGTVHTGPALPDGDTTAAPALAMSAMGSSAMGGPGRVGSDGAVGNQATSGPATAAAPDASPEGVTAAAAGSGGGPASWPGHLWAVCLAVLAAGLAVLLARTARRLRLVATTALAAAGHRVRGCLPQTHPPDLHVLCVLRT